MDGKHVRRGGLQEPPEGKGARACTPMTPRHARHRISFLAVWMAASIMAAGLAPLHAQRGAGAAPQPPQPPRQRAPIDLTGYWVSLITEDWRYRMMTPPKGEALNVPLTAEARRLLQAYDPDKDEA